MKGPNVDDGVRGTGPTRAADPPSPSPDPREPAAEHAATVPRRSPDHGTTMPRRSLIAGGGALAIAALGVGVSLGRGTPGAGTVPATNDPRSASTSGAPTSQPAAAPVAMRTFHSTDLTVPATVTWATRLPEPGMLLTAQSVNDTYRGVILDNVGEPVWIEPTGITMANLRVQSYRGRPVLTYWTGTITNGIGTGTGVILDQSYALVATVQAGHGLDADLHELLLTSRGTALITVYQVVPANLSAVGGPARGYLYDNRVQEIDIATGAVVFDWSMAEHVSLAETYLGLAQFDDHDGSTREKAFDVFHTNAVEEDGDQLLVSSRHTHTIYAVDRDSGAIRWRFGGRSSDIAIPAAGTFAWQHHVRRQDDGTVTLFDNHVDPGGSPGASRALRFEIDETSRTAHLIASYAFNRHAAQAMGSVQALGHGHTVVGWGSDPAVTEFDERGEPIFEATLGGNSYRATRAIWHASPTSAPDIAAQVADTNTDVFVSWNGATDVARWVVEAGDAPGALATVASSPRTGFETRVTIAGASFVRAHALDAHGGLLGSTVTTAVSA